ncbi:MAG: IS110 family transposase [Planctomycetota bacterium]
MRFYTQPHKHYCGIDLHARTMFVCILDAQGNKLLERNIPTSPAEFRQLIAPFREDFVVSAECVFCWYWLADFCAAEGIPFVLGHALYMRAIHGAKAKNDRIDAFKIASLLRGGNMPVSYVYPAEMRTTRDLLRRRLYMVRERGFLLAHIQNTHHQCNLPTPGAKLQWRRNRTGVAEHFTDASVRKTVEVDISVIEHLDTVISELELYLTNTTKEHDANSFYLLRSIPGVGKVLAMSILYEVHDIARFPTVQDFASYARLIRCARESAGKRSGTSGSKIGNAHLKWAISEATVLMLRHADIEKLQNRLRRKHGKGKAMGVLSHKLGRTIYYMLLRRKPFDMERFLAA